MQPRPAPHRARHVLLWLGGAWLAGQLAVGLVLDGAPTWVRFRQGGKVVRAGQTLPPPFVALLGSSRFRGLDLAALDAAVGQTLGSEPPTILQGAVLAGDPVVFDFLLARLIEQNTPPALAILEITPETLSFPSHWVEDHVTRMFTWRDLPAWIGEIAARGRLGNLVEKRVIPIHVYRTELLGWITLERGPYLRVPQPEPRGAASARSAIRTLPLPTGAHPIALAATGPDAKTTSGLRRIRDWLEDYRIGGGATRSLESALARCREAGVPVILVGPPVTSWHRELYTQEILEAYESYLSALRDDEAVPFFEYRDRLPDALFVDNHHLSPEGGAEFASLLGREVIAPAWAARDRGGP